MNFSYWALNVLLYHFNFQCTVQLPRLYNVYKQMGIVKSFQNILDNIFIPLFEVTIDPNSHPQLHLFLMQVSLFANIIFRWPYFEKHLI